MVRALPIAALLAACTGASPEPDVLPRSDDPGVTSHPCEVDLVQLPAAPPVDASWPFLVSANGHTTATIAIGAVEWPDAQPDGTEITEDVQAAVVTWTTHPAHHPVIAQVARDLVDRIAVGLRADGVGTWLDEQVPDSHRWEPGTGIATLQWTVDDLEVTARIFTPMTGTLDLAVTVEVFNGGAVQHTVEVWGLDDVHLGGGAANDGETATVEGNAVLEQRADQRVRHGAMGSGGATMQVAPADPGPVRDALLSSVGLDGSVVDGDDLVVGLQFPEVELMPGESVTEGWVLSHDEGEGDLSARQASLGGSALELLVAERGDWNAWHAQQTLPPTPHDDRRAVALQASAILRMSQVRRDAPEAGALLASIAAGGNNRMLTRDAAHSIAALVAIGQQDAARSGLQFLFDAQGGLFEGELSVAYGIPLSTTDALGTEDYVRATCTSGSDAGIEAGLDALGLVAWAWASYAERWPDDPWLDDSRPQIVDQAAQPLAAAVDPANSLLVADSSGWGRHWGGCAPHGRQAFVYSALVAADGLQRVADETGRVELGDSAQQLARGVLSPAEGGGPVRLVEGDAGSICPVVLASPEQTCDECTGLDALATEIVARRLVQEDGPAARATLAAVLGGLVLPDRPGVMRTDDGIEAATAEELSEWVPADLSVIAALAVAGEHDPQLRTTAETMMDWVTSAAVANGHALPERLSDGVFQPDDDAAGWPAGSDPSYRVQGAMPLSGRGAGAYLLALELLAPPQG